jgi:nucleotide-binding universal stress UspA family protein
MHRILLLTDFSDEANQAITPAGDLAKRLGMGITLFNVIEHDQILPGATPGASPLPGLDFVGEQAAALSCLEGLADDLRKRFDLDVTCEVEIGSNIAQRVAQRAAKDSIAMVALAAHSHAAWHQMLFGSTTESLLAQCGRPMVCFPVQK